MVTIDEILEDTKITAWTIDVRRNLEANSFFLKTELYVAVVAQDKGRLFTTYGVLVKEGAKETTHTGGGAKKVYLAAVESLKRKRG